jgi:peptidyl-prolyl cis-trans isomerase A (cyclophilin A)
MPRQKYKQKQKQVAQQRQQATPKPAKRKPSKYSKSLLIGIAVIAIIVVAIAGLALSGQFGGTSNNPTTIQPTKVLLQTTAGNITIDLRTDKPITSTNFVNLVNASKYDGSTFHRILKTFMIQGGKVNSTIPAIKDEIGSNNHNINYTIAMAKTSAPNSATSEFFINTVDNSGIIYPDGSKFDEIYTVFGTIIAGRDVVDAIANTPVTANPEMNNEESLPVTPVIILHASIIQ